MRINLRHQQWTKHAQRGIWRHLIQLKERFYDSKGIYYNGMKLETLNLRKLRSSIAWVPQEPLLFNATIEENISFGKLEEASEEEIMNASKISGCYDIINSLDGK